MSSFNNPNLDKVNSHKYQRQIQRGRTGRVPPCLKIISGFIVENVDFITHINFIVIKM